MKHTSFLRKLSAAVLSCTLCCTGMTVPAFSADDADDLPEYYDWREEAPEILTPVKDQIGGTCWAYSTLSCIESNMIRKGMADSSIDLSETHLVWFTDGQGSPTDPADTRYGGGLEYGVKGYNAGAYVTVILASLAAWQGVAYESDFPSLSEQSVLDESLRYQSAAHLQNAQYYAYTVKQIPFTKQMLIGKGPLKLDYCHDYDHPISEKSGYYNPDFLYPSQRPTAVRTALYWLDGTTSMQRKTSRRNRRETARGSSGTAGAIMKTRKTAISI